MLAQLARGRMRGKNGRLEEALDCSFLTEEQDGILKMMLGRHRRLHRADRGADRQDRGAGRAVRHQIEQLDAVHGTGKSAPGRHRRDRRDMTVFPTAATGLLGELDETDRECGGKRKGSNAAGATATCAPPRRKQQQRRAHGDLPRRRIPAAGRTQAQKESLDATGNSDLTNYHALLSDRAASYHDRGPGLLRTAHEHPPPGTRPRPGP